MGLIQRVQNIWRVEGWTGVVRRLQSRWRVQRLGPAYAPWLRAHQRHLNALGSKAAGSVGAANATPLFSVLVPVFNPNLAWLEQAVASVRRQQYPHWELCLVDDASTLPGVFEALQRLQSQDQRIRCVRREHNGHIAQATNDAMDMARGDWLVFMDQDDEVEPSALALFAQAIAENGQLGLLYSDEDQISATGQPIKPFFKPDWSPHLALSQAYLGHLVAVNKALCPIRLDPSLNGSQDHDFWLCCCRALKPEQIRHVPHVLYHWRAHSNSTAADAGVKPYAHEAGRKAVANEVAQRYPMAEVRVVDGAYPLTYELAFTTDPSALVSIIIPTKDKPDLLEACLKSIHTHTRGIDYEVLILDNRSVEPDTLAWFEKAQAQYPFLRVLKADFNFNWSKLNNFGVLAAKGSSFVFLNNDTEVLSSNWLTQLNGYAELPDVGVVGALLLFPDGTIQHSGVVLGMGGWADHVFHAQAPDHYSFANTFVSPVLTRNTLAVTGACMAVTRKKYEQLGGFDERFIICGSDVEFCLKAHRMGLYNVMCAQARLVHHESKTRGREVPAVDFEMSALAYEPYRTQSTDPFFSPHLALSHRTPTLNPISQP